MSNAYLFETKRYKAREIKLLPYILKLQSKDIIMQSIVRNYILNNEQQNQNSEMKFFKLNSNKVAKGFNLLLGNERVKTANLVHLMISQNINSSTFNNKRLKGYILEVHNGFKDFFEKTLHKEPLAINYLQASSFLKIIKDLINENKNLQK